MRWQRSVALRSRAESDRTERASGRLAGEIGDRQASLNSAATELLLLQQSHIVYNRTTPCHTMTVLRLLASSGSSVGGKCNASIKKKNRRSSGHMNISELAGWYVVGQSDCICRTGPQNFYTPYCVDRSVTFVYQHTVAVMCVTSNRWSDFVGDPDHDVNTRNTKEFLPLRYRDNADKASSAAIAEVCALRVLSVLVIIIIIIIINHLPFL